MTFYSPLALLFLLTVPVIIILYLLKQRHQDYTVSSLYLWQEVLKDLEANAPWQKLRRNILMILQIIAMILLALALARPYLHVGGKAANVLVAVDTSFSMQATDVKPTRFEAAQRKALEYVANLQPGTLVTLVNIGNNAIIEENLSNDHNRVKEKLQGLKPANGVANLEDAASLIQSVVKQYPETEVVWFGDTEVKVPGIQVKQSIFTGKGENYAVILLSHSSSAKGMTALSRIANFTAEDTEIPVSLYADGKVIDAKNVALKAGETVNVYWNEIPSGLKFLECRIDKQDALAADNIAWSPVNEIKTGKVMLATEKNVFLEKVLSLTSGIKYYKTNVESASQLKGYDLYIFDGALPEQLPKDGNILVFNPPENKLFKVEGDIELPELKKTEHSLFQYINEHAFSVSEIRKMQIPIWGTPILEAKEGPVIFAGSYENRRIMVFGFDIHHSDLPLKPAFPILMTNAIEWLVPSKIKNVESVSPEQGIEFQLDPKAQQVKVMTPDEKEKVIAPPFPANLFEDTSELGKYTLDQKTPDGQKLHYFVVNAPAEKESNLLLETKLSDSGLTAGGANKGIMTGFNLQGLLLLVVIMLLAIEWWVYTHDV